MPTLAFDYMLVTRDNKVIERGAESEDDPVALKVLVAKDTKSKSVFAHAVRNKGPGEDRYAVNVLVKDIKWLGYGRLGLKCDNEPAIVKLLEEVLVASRVKVAPDAPGDEVSPEVFEEHPTPYDKRVQRLHRECHPQLPRAAKDAEAEP